MPDQKFGVWLPQNCLSLALRFILSVNTDVGPKRLAIMSSMTRRVKREIKMPPPNRDMEDEIAHDLEGLTEGISYYVGFEDVPCQYQRHIVGVSNRIH